MTEHKYLFIPVEYNPFEGGEIEKIAPSTEPQKEIFISTLIGQSDANRAYNESFTLELKGALNISAFKNALADLGARHESLRATISANGENIIVFKRVSFHLIEKNITDLDPEKQQMFLDKLKWDEVNTSFNLLKGPLFRPYLIKTGKNSWQFMLTGHHVVFDGWSQGILLQELGKLYNAYLVGDVPFLPQAIQYSQYAQQQLQFIQTGEYSSIKQFWKNQFLNKMPAFDFPTDFPRPGVRTYKSQRIDYRIDSALAAKIKELGIKCGSSFVTTLMVAFELFLYKSSGAKRVIFGLPTAGQSVTGNTHLIGHCVNMLPICSSPPPESEFSGYLKVRKSAILDCYEHQRITFGSLLKEINAVRDASRVTFLPIAFNVDLGMTENVHFKGISYKLINNPRHYETFDFFLNASGSETEMTFEWSYNVKLFRPETIQKLHRYFERILNVVAGEPDIRIKNIPSMITGMDIMAYQQLNNTGKVFPREKLVDELIAEKALAYPLSTAVNFEGTTMTYGELNNKANQLAHYFIENGIRREDLIGLAIDRSLYLPVLILGVLKAGAAFQPIDPNYPPQRIGYILQDGAAKMLITSTPNKIQFTENISVIPFEEILPLLNKYPVTAPQLERSSSDLIYILHTSGSTGKPKGVLIEHKNVVNLLTGTLTAPGLQATDRLLSITSIAFDIFYLELFLPLVAGATMFMISSPATKDVRAIIDCVAKEKITFLQSTPSFWNIIMDMWGDNPMPLKALSGGEALSKELAAKILAKVSELWNGYGPTETTIYASMKKVSLSDEIITIGKPIYNTRFYILDEQKQLVPPGKIGEIFIAGENVGKGYVNLPAVTESRFLPDFITDMPNQFMYQTGDLGKLLENGEVHCLGRADQQVKVNGFRIELGEIEHTMAVVNDAVKQVVIKPFTTNNITHLVAYFTMKAPTGNLPVQTWKQLLKQHLPNYMVPEYYVVMDTFPLTPNGKIDKQKLKQPENLQSSNKKDRTLTSTEAKIKAIWENALGTDKVSLDDDFFEVGGHSLIAAQMMLQIEKVTGKKLPLATLFENSTISSLAAVVDNQKENTVYKSLVPINTNGTKTPLFVVHGSGLNILMFYPLAKYLDKDQPLYGLQALGLDGSAIKGNSIEELAQLYNKELLEAVPGDEYAIVGYSLGGIIAFEMAKQLKAAGKKIKLLGIIDTHIDNEDYHISRFKRGVRKLLRQPKKVKFIFGTFFRHPQKMIQYQLFISRVKIKNLAGKLVPKKKKDLLLEDVINEHYSLAYVNYKLTPYDDKVYLFKVNERIYYIDDVKNLGWKPYCPKGLVVNTIPGDHKTFLLSPNDKVFADKLQGILNNLNTR